MSDTTGVSRDTPEDDTLAGEYVLGTLNAEERATARQRLGTDPAFAREVAWWEDRLSPLASLVARVEAPPALWSRLATSIASAPETPRVVPFPRQKAPRPNLWNNPGFWRSVSGGAIAIAASLLAFIAVRPPAPEAPRLFVAGLSQPGTPAAAFLAEALPDGALIVRATGDARPPGGRDFELWSLAQGEAKPTSLGVLPASGKHVTLAGKPASGTQILVSVEPVGGSPTGQPTGPVVFAGTLAPLDL